MKRLKVIRMYKSCKRGGGVHTRLAELLPRLVEYADVRLLCYRERGDRADELEAAGVPVDVIPLGSKWAPWNVGRYVRYFRRHRPDVVHTHEYTANTLGVEAARRAGVPVIVRHLHSMAPWGWGGERQTARRVRADGRAALRATMTLAVSEAVRTAYLSETGLPASTCRVLYNGIDLERFRVDEKAIRLRRREMGTPNPGALVGFLGRLARGKGCEDFLTVASLVSTRAPASRFVMVGGGDLRARLESLAQELDIGDKVFFPGLRSDVPELLGAMDVFVFPSRSGSGGRIQDGLPGVVIEALAAGVPVVGYRLPMMGELVEDPSDLVAEGDVAGLASRVSEYLEDASRRSEASRRAFGAAARFSLEKVVADTLNLYGELTTAVESGP